MEHSNVFYILSKDGFQPSKGAVPLPNKAGLDLFRLDFDISDGKTGMRILQNDTQDNMFASVKKIEDDAELRKRIADAIERAVAQDGGLSPRYTRPDETYESVFPTRARKSSGKQSDRENQKPTKKEERQKQQAMYEAAVYTAEQSIRNRESVDDIVVRDSSLILCLFRENKISLPPKTRSWITSSFYGADFDASRGRWTFRYNGSFDPSFRLCYDQLFIAITRKYPRSVNNEAG